MRSLKISAVISLILVLIVCIGCNRPEYYTPYGEGVDSDTVVTEKFQSRTTRLPTAFKLSPTTTTTKPVTTTTELVIPPGFILCPDCQGIRVECTYCKGTDKRPAEVMDADTGIYKRYYENCLMCSTEDPGYILCETCRNVFYIAR